ncbi:hypothetical protein N9259_00475 [bacterium]|nr:hypothetical protein [bacterium]MDB4356965.1 hypothetical protein [Akkermansiaceae bacterium]MDB4492004.1 hypothetical protein [bacterium]
MKNPNSPFSLSQSPSSHQSPSFNGESEISRVSTLTERMTASFSVEPALPARACDEIPGRALMTCLDRCRDVIGNGHIGEREFKLVQECLHENLTGMNSLKLELADAEKEHARLKVMAEPFFEMMAPLLGEDDKPLSGLDAKRMASLQETLTELVQGLSFAKYRRDNLLGRLEALASYVTDQVVEEVQARNLGNPHLPQIRKQVWLAISSL